MKPSPRKSGPRHSARSKPARRPREAVPHPSRWAPRPLVPDPTQPIPAVFLRTPTRYPLVYRKRVRRVDDQARPGDLVAVYSEAEGEQPELIGYGLYNPRSEIIVRIVRFAAELPDGRFWDEALVRALCLRRDVLRLDEVTDAYRIVHAEADGFSGLVIDRLGDTLSAEVFSLGMFQRCQEILARLQPLCGTRHTLIQPGPHVLAQEAFSAEPQVSADLPPSVVIQEHGTRFRVHFQQGHKTGFFCDQRDNRRQLASYCAGRSVLDLCCYTGGFAIQAKRLGQAADVIGVDLDEDPLRLARENAALNQVRVKFVQADVFPFMRDMVRGGRQFDVVVLDPPKLVRSRLEFELGSRKYFDLNRLAMQLVRPGGILLTCTCSGLMPGDEFLRLIYAASRQAGPRAAGDGNEPGRGTPRTLHVLAKTGAAADHPVAAHCPETEYLNAVWACLW
ncbi:MAG: class I SAM-dependent rRNA methyltransferase [Pirellulaceae bacterium]